MGSLRAINYLVAQLQEKETQINKLQNMIDSLTKTVDVQNKKINSLQDKITNQNKIIIDLKGKLTEKNERIEILQKRNAEMKQKNKNLENRLAALQKEFDAFRQNAQSKIDNLDKQILQKTEENTEKSTKIEELLTKIQ